MKPFWGIDLTENGNNEDFNGKELLVDKPSDTLKQMHEASVVQATARLEWDRMPRNALLRKACGEQREDFCAVKRHKSNGILKTVKRSVRLF